MGLDPNTRGLLVADVQSGGPADKAGLRGSTRTVNVQGFQTQVGGDIITSTDGKTVNDFEDLIRYMFLTKKIGDTMQLTVLRDGQTLAVTVDFAGS